MIEAGMLFIAGPFGWAIFGPSFGVLVDKLGKKDSPNNLDNELREQDIA